MSNLASEALDLARLREKATRIEMTSKAMRTWTNTLDWWRRTYADKIEWTDKQGDAIIALVNQFNHRLQSLASKPEDPR